MQTTHDIFFNGDLYEIVRTGTLVRSIRKHSANSNMFKEIGFEELPQEVKDELVKQILNP